MYGYGDDKRENCCTYCKIFIGFLKLLGNLAGFICLCILVNWSSGIDYDNVDVVHRLSIATLSITIAYIIFAIIFFALRKKEHAGVYVLTIFTLLLWIARYALFVILMNYIESCNLDKANIKKRKKIKRLKRCFHAFAIIEIIVGAIEQIDTLVPEVKND